MFKHRFTRRDFLKTAGTLVVATSCGSNSQIISGEKGSDGDPRPIFPLRDTLSVSVGGSTGFIYTPNIYLPGEEVPWVWSAPILKGVPGSIQTWLFDRIRNAGFAVVGIDVGESYGSPAGVAIFNLFYAYLTLKYKVKPQAVLFPQSRGGLQLYNWAAAYPSQVSRSGGIYPICDPRIYPGSATAAAAYGMTEAQFLININLYAPVLNSVPLARTGVTIYHISGDSDLTVPAVSNSLAMQTFYRANGGTMTVELVAGHGHEEIAEYFQSSNLLNFLIGI